MTSTVRGIRDNNPGNIDISNIPWQGKIPAADNTDGRFEQFVDPFHGLRALARNLHTYYVEGKNTIAKIIVPYAPDSENDTEAYIATVCKLTGFDQDEVLDLGDAPTLRAICQGIIRVENGKPDVDNGAFSADQWYSDELVTGAVNSALGLG